MSSLKFFFGMFNPGSMACLVPEVENGVEINTGMELLGCKSNWLGGNPEVSAIWQKVSIIFFYFCNMAR